jgi:hypothetical protein
MVRRHLDPYEERRQQDGVRARSYGDEEGQRAQPAIRFAAGCDQQRAGKHSESRGNNRRIRVNGVEENRRRGDETKDRHQW